MSAGENFFMTEEWLHDKRLSWSNRALLSKLYALTQQGTIEKRVSNSFFLDMGFTKRELEQSWRVLQDFGYITKRIDKINGNKSYVMFNQQLDNVKKDFTSETGIPSPQNVETLSTKRGDPIHETWSHHTVSNTNSNTNSNTLVNIYSEHEQKTEPKKKEKIVYPASVEEVEILFNEHIQKWASEKPEIKNINVKYESSLFLDYWQSADWKRKGKAVKSVKGAVATWIANAARNFGYRPRQTHKTAQEIEQFAQGVQELVDQQYNAFNSNNNNNNNNISDAEVVDIKDVSEIENLFLETKTK